MAIAKMKKLTLLAEQANKDKVLKSIQEMQNVEVIPLPDVLEEELIDGFEIESTQEGVSTSNKYYQDLNYSIDFLNNYVSQPGFIEGLRQKREVFSLKELEQHVENTDVEGLINRVSENEDSLNQIDEQKKQLEEEELYLRKWMNLDFLPKEVDGFSLMDVIVGSIDVEYVDSLISNMNQLDEVYVSEIFTNEDQAGYLFIFPKSNRNEVDEALKSTGFQQLDYEYGQLPKEQLNRNQEQRKELNKEEKNVKEEMKSWTETKRDLELAIEYYYNKGERGKAKELILNSEHLFLVSGWIEESKFENIHKNLETNLENNIAIMTDDVQADEQDDVPVSLNNNKLLRPFEMLVEMYSLPKYSEVDPTIWIFPFYFIFFGMMSADAGYGLLLFLGTIVPLKLFELKSGTKRFLTLLNYLSIATIAIGLFFGSFFGFTLPIQVWSMQEDVMPYMIVSVLLGIIHLIVGLLLNAYLNHRQGNHAGAYTDGYSWTMILVGAVLWAVANYVMSNPLLANVGIALMAINLLGIVLVNTFSNDNKLAGFGLGLVGLYDITSYIGDVVSYTRLMALGVAGANIAMAFNIIVGILPPVARFTVGILIFIILHAVNIGIVYLGAYVHSARLMYVEYFGKFYDGGGKAFAPLKPLEEHIWIGKRK